GIAPPFSRAGTGLNAWTRLHHIQGLAELESFRCISELGHVRPVPIPGDYRKHRIFRNDLGQAPQVTLFLLRCVRPQGKMPGATWSHKADPDKPDEWLRSVLKVECYEGAP